MISRMPEDDHRGKIQTPHRREAQGQQSWSRGVQDHTSGPCGHSAVCVCICTRGLNPESSRRERWCRPLGLSSPDGEGSNTPNGPPEPIFIVKKHMLH